MPISNIPTFDYNTNIIESLGNPPQVASALELMQAFDETGGKLKEYVNNEAVPRINQLIESSSNTVLPGQIMPVHLNNATNSQIESWYSAADNSVKTWANDAFLKAGGNGVASGDITNNAVTADKIDTNAVITDKINDFSVTTAKLANSAVTDAKLGAGIDYSHMNGQSKCKGLNGGAQRNNATYNANYMIYNQVPTAGSPTVGQIIFVIK